MDLIQGTITPSPTLFLMLTFQDYAFQAHSLYQTLNPYLTPLRRTFTSTLSTVQSHATPILTPLLQRTFTFAQESPAIISAILLVGFFIIAIKVLDTFRRMLLWWTRLVMRLMFWGVLGLVGAMVSQRGLERSVRDLVGWGEEISAVWMREYRRWEGYQQQGSVEGMRGGRARW
ncbi:hypothetical protein GLAREA_12312 [Glarea lozoyensis ATCC 20868]|uniref:Uncharacterized protein n=1 Tax=Glarea lozoyensis (strain ATCC 20868 / MF5171) TaxID=1116229 RepID=S3DHP0_GLAL2|nr:uncharacterized protein GLAREA_12312 [Glarea lozoyensis ATCC 20868]EPE31556.1 hypothetical protein GLAREA_12312 [Glarea lozoyensis ATCC 20868]